MSARLLASESPGSEHEDSHLSRSVSLQCLDQFHSVLTRGHVQVRQVVLRVGNRSGKDPKSVAVGGPAWSRGGRSSREGCRQVWCPGLRPRRDYRLLWQSVGGPSLRKATFQDIPLLADMLGRAFMDDPVSNYVFPDVRGRQGALSRFFGIQLRHDFVADGEVFLNDELTGA